MLEKELTEFVSGRLKGQFPDQVQDASPGVQRDVLHLLLDEIIHATSLVTEKEKELGI